MVKRALLPGGDVVINYKLIIATLLRLQLKNYPIIYDFNILQMIEINYKQIILKRNKGS